MEKASDGVYSQSKLSYVLIIEYINNFSYKWAALGAQMIG